MGMVPAAGTEPFWAPDSLTLTEYHSKNNHQ